MAIAVYKEGDKHTVNGVRCEIVLCIDAADMNARIKEGCVHNEKELLNKKEKSKKVDLVQTKNTEGALNGTAKG